MGGAAGGHYRKVAAFWWILWEVLSILPMTGCLCSCYVSVHREKVPVCFSTVLALFPTANCNLVIFLARLGELSCGLAGVHR